MAERPNRSRPAVPPVVLSSTFAFPDTESEARAARERTPDIYTRWSNPTLTAAEDRIAALEGADRALVCGSGMAAITLSLFGTARRGGRLLVQEPVYGGTHELCEHVLGPMGIDVLRAPVDGLIAAAGGLPTGSTIYLEVPANPTNRVADLPAIRRAAPSDAQIVVDATFATPLGLRPLAHGATLSVHSASKYLGGHHDLIAGCVAGDAELMEEIWSLRKLFGPVLDPAGAYRLWRGLETLELRFPRQCQTARILASRLDEHGAVAQVHHPSVPTHPDHETAARLLDHAGAVVSFEVRGDGADARAVANRLERFSHAPSLGGINSLVSWPAGVSHVGLSPEEQARSGVPPSLLRLAIGVEEPDLLWSDLASALGSSNQ